MSQGIFDIEAAGNIFPNKRDNVVWISDYESQQMGRDDLNDELMVFPRTLGIDMDEAEQKRAALIMLGAASVFVPLAVATAIKNGPLPF